MSAKTAIIDRSAESVLAVCPHCGWRDIGVGEAALRGRLLRHLDRAHTSDAAETRDALRRWFNRRAA